MYLYKNKTNKMKLFRKYSKSTVIFRPDSPTIVPSDEAETFFVISTSPHPEQSNRSITFTDPFGNRWNEKK